MTSFPASMRSDFYRHYDCHFYINFIEKQIDLDTVDLKKLRVKELKKILSQWGENCRGCVEKTEFIDKINTVKLLHTEL